MKRWILSVLLGCGWAAACVAQETPSSVQDVTLKNGLRVLLAPDSLAPAVDVSVWYGAGTRYERAGQTGLTHLMERLMFRGSPHHPAGEHRRLVLERGGSANTFTTPDVSCFFDTVPADALGLVLGLEADRMGTLKLTDESIRRERVTGREERRRMYGGNPIALGLQRLYATAFPGHPYGWPVIGLESDLDRLTLAACEAYQRERYSPANAVLEVVGRFDPADALRLVHQSFDPLPRRPVRALAPVPLPAQTRERRAAETIEGEISLVLVGWRAPGGADRSRAALEALSRLLTTGPASRLQQALTRPPVSCLAIEGGFDARREASLLFVAAALRPGADSADVERALLGECEKLATRPADPAELDRVKREAEVALLLESQTARGRAQALGEAEAVFGDRRLLAERMRRLRELTPDEVMAAAAGVFRPDQRSIVWLLSGKPAGARPATGGPGKSR